VVMTKSIIEACRIFGIAVHDHVIIGKEGHRSLKSMGLM
jgi:DNA repair protein RadC